MRDRHLARLCQSCRAPMARQQNVCWRCRNEWLPEGVIPLRVRARRATDLARAEVRFQTDRWIDEGGSASREPVAAPG